MSKNAMTHVWSWDHCFNAMALRRDPEAAADQLLTIFDHQDEHGALPDYVDDVELEPNFVKPPVHGWAIAYLLDRDGLTPAHVEALYDPLVRWTRWWLAHRDYRGDGVPSYNHGNDSGWDNATVFADGVPLQSPDLLAFLALQMAALARMADLLGREAEATGWRDRAAATVDLMIDHFWVEDRFVARGTHDQQAVAADSLLTLMPLALGDLLPEPQRSLTTRRLLEGGYLTAHGLATEPPSSARYEPDGYWRGPIWAPSTMLLVDGLRRSGQHELADVVAERFVALCAASGMAENFDALTGAGLRDRSMTWTAAVLLELATPSG
jgi:putative isomerase